MGRDTERNEGDRGGKAFAQRTAVVGRAEGRRGRDDTRLLLQLQRAPTPPGASVKTPSQIQEAKAGPHVVHISQAPWAAAAAASPETPPGSSSPRTRRGDFLCGEMPCLSSLPPRDSPRGGRDTGVGQGQERRVGRREQPPTPNTMRKDSGGVKWGPPRGCNREGNAEVWGHRVRLEGGE